MTSVHDSGEPAANSHTPPGWSIEVVELQPSGKAPKAYGPDTFRFGAALTLSVILPRRGWTLVKQTKTYAYLKPPADQLVNRRPKRTPYRRPKGTPFCRVV